MVDSVQLKSAKLKFVCAAVLDRTAAAQFAADRGIILADSLGEILSLSHIDAVFLATPHSLHLPQVLECAVSSRPVFAEKPLALSLADARRAVDACRKAFIPMGIGTDRRMLPAMIRLKWLVDQGQLGEILHTEGQYSNDLMSQSVSGSWRSSEKEAPGAGMAGPGLHALDAMIHLLGPVTTIRGQLSQPKGRGVPIDTVSLLVGFANGATGLLGCVRGVPNYFRIAVFGTKGWAELRHFSDLDVSINGRQARSERYPCELVVGTLLESFADAVTGTTEFPVSPCSMLQVVAAFETAINALESDAVFNVPEVIDGRECAGRPPSCMAN